MKTLDRVLREAWNEERGFLHRIGGAPLAGSLEDHAFAVHALLDAFEATLDTRYFQIAQKAADRLIEKFGDAEGGGFFDRASDAPAMGGLDVRRKPLQDSPTPAGNSVAALALDRLWAYTGDTRYRDCAQRTLEAFAGIALQYGLFAATYGLAALLHARHLLQVVITGDADDPQARHLEEAATGVYRFGKAVLRVTPEHLAANSLPPALKETLPNLRVTDAQALVCVETSCQPPTSDPGKLAATLQEISASAAVK